MKKRIEQVDGQLAFRNVAEIVGSCANELQFEAAVVQNELSADLTTAIRWTLQLVEDLGNRNSATYSYNTSSNSSVEVRIVPHAAVQYIPGSSQHRRGTPPNVLELSAWNWLRILTRSTSFVEVLQDVTTWASGTNILSLGPVLNELSNELLTLQSD